MKAYPAKNKPISAEGSAWKRSCCIKCSSYFSIFHRQHFATSKLLPLKNFSTFQRFQPSNFSTFQIFTVSTFQLSTSSLFQLLQFGNFSKEQNPMVVISLKGTQPNNRISLGGVWEWTLNPHCLTKCVEENLLDWMQQKSTHTAWRNVWKRTSRTCFGILSSGL